MARDNGLHSRIETEIAELDDPLVARVLVQVLTNLSTEYMRLAERNRTLILRFSTRVQRLLALLVVLMIAVGVLSIVLAKNTASDATARQLQRGQMQSAKSRVTTVSQRCELTLHGLKVAARADPAEVPWYRGSLEGCEKQLIAVRKEAGPVKAKVGRSAQPTK